MFDFWNIATYFEFAWNTQKIFWDFCGSYSIDGWNWKNYIEIYIWFITVIFTLYIPIWFFILEKTNDWIIWDIQRQYINEKWIFNIWKLIIKIILFFILMLVLYFSKAIILIIFLNILIIVLSCSILIDLYKSSKYILKKEHEKTDENYNWVITKDILEYKREWVWIVGEKKPENLEMVRNINQKLIENIINKLWNTNLNNIEIKEINFILWELIKSLNNSENYYWKFSFIKQFIEIYILSEKFSDEKYESVEIWLAIINQLKEMLIWIKSEHEALFFWKEYKKKTNVELDCSIINYLLDDNIWLLEKEYLYSKNSWFPFKIKDEDINLNYLSEIFSLYWWLGSFYNYEGKNKEYIKYIIRAFFDKKNYNLDFLYRLSFFLLNWYWNIKERFGEFLMYNDINKWIPEYYTTILHWNESQKDIDDRLKIDKIKKINNSIKIINKFEWLYNLEDLENRIKECNKLLGKEEFKEKRKYIETYKEYFELLRDYKETN